MAEFNDVGWIDEDAGRLIRPYTVSEGRTTPTHQLDLLSQVRSTGQVHQWQLAPEQAQVLDQCQKATSVAEVAAQLQLPAVVTKVLLSDLLDYGAVTTKPPAPTADPTDVHVLEAVLDGLRRRL